MNAILNLLIFEDVEADFLLINRHLRQNGLNARCRWVRNADELVRALDEGGWDAVLSDYKMPGLDFLENLAFIRVRLPEVPVILVSGSVGEETAVELLKQGLWDFVLKDNLARLIPVIKRSLGEAAERRARRAAEAALKIQEEKYRKLAQEYQALLDNVPDGIVLLSPDLSIRWANKSATNMVAGDDGSALQGSSWNTVFRSRESCRDSCPVVRSIASGRCEIGDFSTPNGRELEFRTVPILGESGAVESVIDIIRDVTENRKLEAQLRQAQKMESIGTLAGGIAHDFNNILTVITGYGEFMLMEMARDDPRRLNLEIMLEAAQRAVHLTGDLLLFSRKQACDKKPADLNKIIGKVEKFLKRVIGEDIECQTRLSERPLLVLADAHQLEQVLMNFATNARDVMPKGGVFSVSTERIVMDDDFVAIHGLGHPGPHALITISDTGRGMDETTRQKIFEPFFTTKEMGKGTGLGLAVVYGIIKQHDGSINVYSEPGKGTTFRIYLPVVESDTREKENGSEEKYPVGGKETILVAEDDESVRKLSATILKQFGYTVIEAVDGQDAVRKYKENMDRVHLLLFDLIMPKMGGKEAYDEIRKIRPDVKAICVSGYVPDDVRREELLQSNLTVLSKPVSPLELLRKIRSLLDAS
ncbi:MAG: response regulator [Deltaproteobacteria bacterium]|nr:response regulator [Deltaproteobacteria bacterium]